jgi:hypothetical protein
MTFSGIDKVDPAERQKQHALTQALWSVLKKQGLENGAPSRIECFFFAAEQSACAALAAAFSDWEHSVAPLDGPTGKWCVRLITPEVRLTRQAFLELADVALIAALESSCVFDGFQVDTSGLPRRPWWKFW